MNSKKAQELRQLGNECMTNKKYAEALLHYTHGIKLDPRSSKMLANRSLAFLKLDQYYYAMEDAKQTIDLEPKWFKGYLRRASVQFQCGLYDEAIKSYNMALHFLDNQSLPNRTKYELEINDSIKQSIDRLQKQLAYDLQIPWIGAAIGLVAGMALITWDYVTNRADTWVKHPILKLLIIISVSLIFFQLARIQRRYTKNYRETLLKPPIDLFKD